MVAGQASDHRPMGTSDEPLWIRPDSRTGHSSVEGRPFLASRLRRFGVPGARNRLGAGDTLPHRGANWTNPATLGHNQRRESLDFLGSPKGSNPFCSSIFF